MKSLDTTSLRDQQSLEVLRLIDEACTTFERALRRGEILSIEAIVGAAQPEVRQSLLRDLLVLEMEYRAKSGESPSLDEYRQRFPDQVALIKYLYLEQFVPAQLADFSIQRLLGRGAYGHVYQGWDSKLTRNVAIKVFRRDPMTPVPRGGSLRAEARNVAQLRHPGIVSIHAVQQDVDGDEFLVLEFVDGKSLEDLLRSDRLSLNEATQIMLDVVQALQHAHQQGLVHRDMKPANILLDGVRRPRVTDFGLALHVATAGSRHEIAGTLAYMAPEQACGETHRLDCRTDLWAIGVILYRILSGKLPFTGNTPQELLEAIRYAEPPDLREIKPQIPPELARIVRRCLVKRMSDRYGSAAELAEDLNAYGKAGKDCSPVEAARGESPIAVVPKGLRCFDANDRDFFLALVPGPRDRHGIPSAVLFWERHLKELNANETFRVGLLYGPSGCGKSSLVRAGILPRLPQHVTIVVVEGARDETELRLIRELRRRFPEIAPDASLPEMLQQLREGACLERDQKVVIVFDQFEQWLHGWRQDVTSQLLEALRQCDGGRVQTLILVRDDFWMPATRFFQQLDVPLVEGSNTCAVDLFDRTHAMKVLAAFGKAYGRLDDNSWRHDGEQRRFLDRALDELDQDGWIVPVRLCIFAEMVKSRPWSTSTLRDVGGAQGLGAAFLEEAFDGRTTSPMYRLHRKAARLVLERLLPPIGTDIRGHLVAESELQAVSGYDSNSIDFVGLLHCLDHELRLITPSELDAVASSRDALHSPPLVSPRLYQLTHDFLVTAIRGWLNQARRRTLQGRAELRLAEYADAYTSRPEARQLPHWWDWLSALALTRSTRWRPSEKAMMQRATRHYALRSAIVFSALLLLGIVGYDRLMAEHANGLVEAVASSDSRDLPQAIARLAEYQRWTGPMLLHRLEAQSQDSDQSVRLQLGLLALGVPKTDDLFDRLLDADPPLSVAIANVLFRHGKLQEMERRLWAVAEDDQRPFTARLRASVALARLPSVMRADIWSSHSAIAETLLLRDVSENPGHFNTWVDAFAPARTWLVEPLRKSFADASRTEAERVLAANILVQYVDDVSQIVELALQSSPKQFEVVARTLGKRTDVSLEKLVQIAHTAIPADAVEEDKDHIARRQANAILLLRELGEPKQLWPALHCSSDPRTRSFLIDQLGQLLDRPEQLLQRLSTEEDPGIRQAIVLILGSAALTAPAIAQSPALLETLLRLYRDDIDSGVHGAAELALQRLGADSRLEPIRAELASLGMRPNFTWYVTKSQITMTIVAPPGAVQLGSPETEPGRDASDEKQWTSRVDWAFAISATEMTQSQFREVFTDYTEPMNDFAPDPACPANVISWLEAMKFCRLLSERDGVVTEEMAVPPVDQLQQGLYPDFSTCTGYRLPTEVEWELACRAGTTTPRFFGYAPALLSQYACYIENSPGHSRPVGRGLPNQIGLFDMLGNVSEWCLDIYAKQPDALPQKPRYSSIGNYVVRGGDFTSNERMMRTANRRFDPPAGAYSRGFRIAHTIRLRGDSE